MTIKYIPHALEQMRKRQISKGLVEEAIINGQKRYTQKNHRVKCTYIKDGKTVVVIYRQDKVNCTVITAYFPL
jgi:hypothetical protein